VLPTLRRLVSALFRSGLFLFLPDAFSVLTGARFGLGALFVRLLIRVRTLIVHAMSPSREYAEWADGRAEVPMTCCGRPLDAPQVVRFGSSKNASSAIS
jgi:hypothetical protein